MAGTGDKLKDFALQHPRLLAALAGGATGAAVGAASSEEGEEMRGILGGGALGTGAGIVVGGASNKLRQLAEALTPTPQKAIITGGILGGGLAGYYGRGLLPEWVKQRLMTESNLRGTQAAKDEASNITGKKEASDMTGNEPTEQEKQAEFEKTAAEQLAAFDYGVDVLCHDNGITKEALANAYGLTAAEFTQKVIECANEVEQATE